MKLAIARWIGVLLVCHAAGAQIITTVAGTDWSFPSGSLTAVNAPLGPASSVAADTAGNVCVADPVDNLVLRISVNGTLNVVAGNGILGFSGDGGPATSGSLLNPAGVAVDSAGNIYIADSGNCRIRKVSNGTITTVAGNGNCGFSGDGGPALSASLNYPQGLAADSAGNLYVADTFNNRIRKISNGTITTIAGNGNGAFSGDGGPATGASLYSPFGVAVDSAGAVYIADSGDDRIRKVSNGTITTVAGNGTAGLTADGGSAIGPSLGEPYGVAVDSAGNIYIADEYFERVWKVSNGIITTVAGGALGFSGDGGAAARAALYSPEGVAVDSDGNVYIADTNNDRIRKVSGGVITTVAGNGNYRFSGDGGAATAASMRLRGTGSLFVFTGAAVDLAGNLYIADTANNRIRMVSKGTITTVAGNGDPSFSGDGGPATNASLFAPQGVAVDSTGNIFIVDSGNYRIRKVSGGTITTLAGNGAPGYSGDGGPAAGASFGQLQGIAVDSAGNLYIADSGNQRIRKISDGTIITVAGNGNEGFSGDGGPATGASLDFPFGAAVDLAGNIYIADTQNNRIRKVSGGMITTVAGNGNEGFSGDEGPATGGSLSIPSGVAVDSTGNVYIAEFGNSRIRKVSNGVITTVAGTGEGGFYGDGGPATSAWFSFPTGVAVDSAGNLYITDQSNNRIREVPAAPPVFTNPVSASAGSVSLSQASGGEPVSATITASTIVSESSSTAVPGMAYSAAVASGNSWLSVSPQSGITPGLLTVTADPVNLEPGAYDGSINLNLPLANPPTQTLRVRFTVTAGVPAAVSVDQSHMSFTYATTSAARSQTLIVSNSGGGSLEFTTSVMLNSGIAANWLSVAPQGGTATPGNRVSLAVTADPSMLGSGTYTGSIIINAVTAGSVTVPVTMTITTNPLVLLLSQAGLTFTAVQNGGAIPPQTFGVLNLGSGNLNWSVQISTLSGGNWLNVSPGSGTSDSGTPNGVPLVTAGVNPAGLAPGVYYGLVKVDSSGAANSPQEVVVVLRVLPAGTNVAPVIQPNSLVFSSPAGNSSPSSQNVLVYDPTGTGKSFSSGIVLSIGEGWLATLPGDATIPPSEPVQIVVQPSVSSFPPGTYLATLTLQFSDGTVSTVGITFVVTPAATSGSTSSATTSLAIPAVSGSSGCTPTKLIPVLTTLGPGFNVPAGYPQGLTVQVADDCGTPLTQGRVSVQFSTGQGLKYMQSLNNGRWDLTWQPGSQQVSQVTLSVHAQHPTLPITGDAQVNGALGAPQAAPQVSDGGVVTTANYMATPLAPGSIISIFGSQLSDGASPAPVLPLPTELDNTTVKLGDMTLPLFYTSAGQVNALVPYEAAVNTNLQLLVQRDNTYATPVYVDVGASQPAIFEYGTQQTAIAVDVKGNLNGPANPAHAGDVLVMYCSGLGAVTPAVADGAAASLTALTYAMNPVTLTVGNQTANAFFTGLSPGSVGLYQINFYVPQGTPTGDQVPVMVAVAGQTSAVVNLSVR